MTSVNKGYVTITATITVDGIEYSDTAEIEVTAPVQAWEEVLDITAESTWIDPAWWLKANYTEQTRRTYLEHNGEANTISLVLNPNGQAASLYMDWQIAINTLALNHNVYDYALYLEWTSANIDATLETTLNDSNVFVADGWSGSALSELNQMYLPLSVRNMQGTRLITLQARYASGESGSGELSLKFMRKEK